jgi:hypothetical protein
MAAWMGWAMVLRLVMNFAMAKIDRDSLGKALVKLWV